MQWRTIQPRGTPMLNAPPLRLSSPALALCLGMACGALTLTDAVMPSQASSHPSHGRLSLAWTATESTAHPGPALTCLDSALCPDPDSRNRILAARPWRSKQKAITSRLQD